jgi:hypothetical protein
MLLADLRTLWGHSDMLLNEATLAPEIVRAVGARLFQRTTRRKRLVAGVPEYGFHNGRDESLETVNLRERTLEHHCMVTRRNESEPDRLLRERFHCEGL